MILFLSCGLVYVIFKLWDNLKLAKMSLPYIDINELAEPESSRVEPSQALPAICTSKDT